MSNAAWTAALLIPTLATSMPAAWGSGSRGTEGGKIDACALVSVDEAREVLGTEVATKPIDMSAAGPDAASMCSFQTGHVGSGFMLLAGRLQYDDAAAEVADRKKEASSVPPGIPTPTFTDVSDLGEAAYLEETPESLELHVLDHGAVIVLTMTRKPDAAAESLVERLARFAIRRLGSQADR